MFSLNYILFCKILPQRVAEIEASIFETWFIEASTSSITFLICEKNRDRDGKTLHSFDPSKTNTRRQKQKG